MKDPDEIRESVLLKYHRFILHMRQRYKDNMLTLCFGAGVSNYWNCPTWDVLVERISQNGEFKGIAIDKEIKKQSVTSKAQILFEKLKSNNPDLCEDEVTRKWIKIIHDNLYDQKSVTYYDHPYLNQFLNLIINSPVTINYNFDDYIEQLVYNATSNNNNIENNTNIKHIRKPRVYETVWLPSTQFKRKKGVIYHPNGYIPKMLHEGYSEHFVFTEKSFADQLLDSMYGHYNTLFSIYSRYTTLFIGLSLSDNTLKHLLHHNAKLNPGNYHYYIYYVGDNDDITDEEKYAIQSMYFNVYNLLVMFMTNEEISALGYLINKKHDISDLSLKLGLPNKYRYYISGIPGSGKTTSLNYFKMLSVHTEWPEKKIANLDVPHDKLTPDEVKEVDEWIDRQFKIKNYAIYNDQSNIQIIDRSLLDPLAFKNKDDERSERGRQLKTIFDNIKISDGHLILLDANPLVTNKRLLKRNSEQRDNESTYRQSKQFREIFSVGEKDTNYIDTSFLTKEDVVKQIGEIMFFHPYVPIDFNKILDKYINQDSKTTY